MKKVNNDCCAAPVWVVGCHGMLGCELMEVLSAAGIPCVGTGRERDITDTAGIAAFVRGQRFAWIVNAAAYTAVDRAEDEPEQAQSLNALGAENLAHAATTSSARLIQLSTDYVFDGTGRQPYTEEDPVSPVGVYARTKAEGERRVVVACPEAVILRTAWLYGRHGPNFVHTLLRLLRERQRVTVVDDQYGTPTHTASLCRVILALMSHCPHVNGLYHVTDGGEATWFSFATAIAAEAARLGLVPGTCRVEPCTTAAYPTRARRPPYSVLSQKKITALLGVAPTPWRLALANFLQTMPPAADAVVRHQQEASC